MRAERLGDAADVRVEDARELANLTSTYDMVMMLEVLEHLEHPETMLPVLDKLADRAVLMSVPPRTVVSRTQLRRG